MKKSDLKKPNIIFIFADQMRASALGCMGIEGVKTPNLDRFAKEGTLFERAISNHPVCCPARATIMTGLHSINHGLVSNDQQIRTDLPTIAGGLNSAGYKCGYIGKWHMDCIDRGIFTPPGPRRLGFDDLWAAYNCNHDYSNGYYYLNDNPEPIWIEGYEPIAQTDIAIDYIKKKSSSKSPYCLFLSFGPPHCPYHIVPQKYLDMYPEDNIKFKPNAVETADKKKIAGYYAHITALDECFGRIIDVVNSSDDKDNTIVIFTSDHGDMLFSQNRGWKMKPWIEAVNIPFIVRWPGHVPAGRHSDAPIGLVDVMPTLLTIAGIPLSENIDGNDLSQLFLGNEESAPEHQLIYNIISYSNYSVKEWRGIVTRTHTYARLINKDLILYNDKKDPNQLVNLTFNPLYESLKESCEKTLTESLTAIGDPFLTSTEANAEYVDDKIVVSPDKDTLMTYLADEYACYCDDIAKVRPTFIPDPPANMVTRTANKNLNVTFFVNKKIRGTKAERKKLFHRDFFTDTSSV